MERVIAAIRKEVSLCAGASPVPHQGLLALLLTDFLLTQSLLNLLSTASWRGVWNLLDLQVLALYGSLSTTRGCLLTCGLSLLLPKQPSLRDT